jgi:hypothetical protein
MRVGAVLCALCLATSCGGDPGTDPAPGTTETGAGAGGGDAQGGGPDAGAPATGSGGGTGGGGGGAGDGAPIRFASASVERLDASAECDGLVPASVPEPVVARLAPAAGRCVAGLSDGTGAVALGAGEPSGVLGWQVHSATGEPAGRFEAALPLLSQPSGWHGLLARAGAGGEDEIELRAFRPDGSTARATRVSPEPGTFTSPRWELAADPRGGAAVVFRALDAVTLGDRFLLHRFDASGVRLAEPAQVAFFMRGRVAEPMAAGASTRGDALVLMPAQAEWRPTWISPEGRFVTDGTDRHEVVPLAPVSLAPLLDGGLALAVSGRWARVYDHLGRASAPAPAWLAERAAWAYRPTRGGRGYALLEPAGASAPGCTQRIDLVAPSGRLCGRVTLREDAAGCTTGALDQGWDGTVVQQSGTDACAFRWWPGLLGP